ncbi:copine family protein 2-like [Cocos nucifera]|uniref:Copine family protein 2-like n=1 Tax=Cocos nucifera TaxID=13894 RepID=A0A8K0IYW5_COCNU|nr:copine family protein 2-like [Cocos nucifera]
METLPLIDVSSEDDLLISASSNAVRDLPYPGLSENHDENKTVGAEEGDGPVKMSKQMEQVLELSESPERKRINSRKYNLRKSLAWDSAFFTSEGVLNPEELAIVNSTFGKAEASSLPGIPEDTRKSTESTSTLDGDPLVLENLEVELFENVRASIQKSLAKDENASNVVDSCKTKEYGELNAPFLGSSKTIEILSQNKKKPPFGVKRHVVTKKLSDHTSESPRIVRVATNRSADSKPSLKPPRVVSRATLPTAPNKSGFGQRNIQPRRSNGKPSLGNLINRQSVIVPHKIDGDSSFVTSNSVRSPKATSGSPLGKPVLSTTSCSSHGGSVSSSSDSTGKSPLETRKRVASRITKHSSPGSTAKKTPVKASKIKTMTSNASNLPIHPKSTFKFSANVSPNSSLDSVASESSSSPSVTMKPSILRDSLDTGSLTSSPALAGPESIIFHSSRLQKLSTGHPYVRSENSATILHSQCISKDSSEIRVISEPSIKDDSKRCTNSNSSAKSIKPSGLRRPTPKIGYFDAEKSLVRNVETFSLPGKLIRSTTGNGSTVGVNKLKPGKLHLIRPAAKNASTNFDPPRIQLTSLSSTHSTKPASPTCLQQPSKPSDLGGTIRMTENHDSCSDVSKDLPPCSSEESHSKVSKVANGVVDAAEFGQFSNPSAGEQASQEHSEFVTAFPFGNESMMSNGKDGDCIGKVKTYGQPSCGYIKESHMESDLHSVTTSIEKENLFPADKTDGRSIDLQAKDLKLPMIECIEERASALSLS